MTEEIKNRMIREFNWDENSTNESATLDVLLEIATQLRVIASSLQKRGS